MCVAVKAKFLFNYPLIKFSGLSYCLSPIVKKKSYHIGLGSNPEEIAHRDSSSQVPFTTIKMEANM